MINKTTQNKNEELKTSLKEWIGAFLVAFILVYLIRTFIIGSAIVDGPSMMNTIQSGDRIFYAKLVNPEKGNIVVVETEDGTKIIKRVIGLEGDKIEIKSGVLYVNGEKQTEDYIMEPMLDTDFPKQVVPKGEIFVMGDNRNVSADSRMFGTFDLKDQYQGKVILEIFNNFKMY